MRPFAADLRCPWIVSLAPAPARSLKAGARNTLRFIGPPGDLAAAGRALAFVKRGVTFDAASCWRVGEMEFFPSATFLKPLSVPVFDYRLCLYLAQVVIGSPLPSSHEDLSRWLVPEPNLSVCLVTYGRLGEKPDAQDKDDPVQSSRRPNRERNTGPFMHPRLTTVHTADGTVAIYPAAAVYRRWKGSSLLLLLGRPGPLEGGA